jgi:hypothetical protein
MVDDMIYWIGSHGRNAKGKESPMRQRIIATRVSHARGGLQIEPVSKPYTMLLDDLITDERFAGFGFKQAATKAPKDKGALNIEGLTATPEGHLLIGFRNPIPNGRAIILTLLNPRKLFEGDRAQFGEPVTLDLKGLGIRSLGFHEGRCLIIAGHYAEGGNSRVFEWKPGEPDARLLEDVKLTGLNPEGMSFSDAGGKKEFLVVSDDGTRSVDGQELQDAQGPRAKAISRDCPEPETSIGLPHVARQNAKLIAVFRDGAPGDRNPLCTEQFHDLLVAERILGVLVLHQFFDDALHAGVAHRFAVRGLVAGE